MPPIRGIVEAELHDLALGWFQRTKFGIELELVGAQNRVPTYQLSGSGATVFDMPTDGYALLDVETATEHMVVGRRLTIAVRVQNVANTEYRDYLSRYKTFALNPGRNLSLRLGWEL